MAHEIEYRTDRQTNSFAFVGDRNEIWHGLGQQMKEGASAAEWIAAANQDFEVATMAVAGISKEEGDLAWTEHKLLYRTDGGRRPLSMVGADWKPAQNQQAYAFAQPFIDVGYATINTAGVLFDGKICFLLLKTNDGFQLPGGDETERWILVQISHRYGNADLVIPVDIRVVCNNTRRAALDSKDKTALAQGKFIHTAETSFGVEKAQALIECYRKGLGAYAEKAKFLASKRATPEQTRAYINKVFKLEAVKEGAADVIARRQAHNERVVQNLLEAVQTQPGANMSEGSWWSNFHAVTYWEDHGRHAEKQDKPFWSKFEGASADRKDAALKTALEMAE